MVNTTYAADRLGLSASGVSKAITRLEEELGVRLLNRTTRTVSLTDDGASFVERCRQILADLEEAETVVTRARAAPKGRLRVHMPVGFGRRVIGPTLSEFSRRYPELVLDVELSDRGIDLAEDGMDAAIVIGDPTDQRVIMRKLFEIRFATCAAPSYLARHGEPQTPNDLSKHQCLGYLLPYQGKYRDWQFRIGGRISHRPISGNLNLNNAESTLDACMAGAGIAHMGTFIAAEAVAAGKLKVILKSFAAPGPQVSLIYLPNRHLSARVRAFVDYITEAVPSMPPWDAILRP